MEMDADHGADAASPSWNDFERLTGTVIDRKLEDLQELRRIEA